MTKILFQLADLNMPNVKYNCEKDDLELLLGEICMNRVAGIAYKNIINNSGIIVSDEIVKILKIVYENNLIRNEKYCNNVNYISKIMKNANFKYAMLKGAFLSTCVYESGMRTSNDIDILIEEENVSKCQEILINNGFIQGAFIPGKGILPATRRDIILARLNFGETVPFVKIHEGEPLVVDLNFSIDYKPERGTQIVKDLLDNTAEIAYEDTVLKCLNIDDFIVHLCCHLYKEATIYDWVKRRKDLLLYKFSDLNVIFSRYMNDELVNTLSKRINGLGLNKECYYALYNTGEIFPQLYKKASFKLLLEEIIPNDLTFMKQIYNPMEKKLYSYNCTFIEWFELRNRVDALKLIHTE